MKKFTFLLVATLFLVSCNPKATEELSSANFTDAAEDMVSVSEEVNAKIPVVTERKLIKNGSISIEVREIKAEKIKIDSLLKKYQAYFDTETTNLYDNTTILTLVIRIPAHNFEKFISGIENDENKITNKEISTEDVTEQYIDLETRLQNKRKFMARYQELLKSAKTIKEMLEIQEKIRSLEEEIESVTGRLKYLSNQVSYSTLHLNITQENDFKYSPEKRDSIFEKLKQSIIEGWFIFVDFLFILLYNWVFLILIFVGIYLFRKFRKKRKQKSEQKQS